MMDVEKLIRTQVALWGAQEQQEKHQQGRGKVGGISYGPYVLISREKGAGGHTVAELVGKKLGWQVYDREIVDEIAKQAHVRRELIESLDENDRGALDGLLASLFGQGNNDATRYEYQLRQVILALGHRGRVVIVGRGGRFILPDQFGLSARLIAPVKTRIHRIAAEQKLAFAAAQTEVNRVDHDRTDYIRRYFHQEINDQLLHDLIINTEEMSAQATAETILTALHQKFSVTPT
ncbi:MAG: cytidylate kinase-like family protein [Kiritimatiellaeota bacterium]|nr:cytidylate kinase-like family protein [Kiritimatiellota bacterium]